MSSRPISREVEHFVDLLKRHGAIGVLATLSEALRRLDDRTSRVPFRFEDVASPYLRRKEQIDKMIQEIDTEQSDRRNELFSNRKTR